MTAHRRKKMKMQTSSWRFQPTIGRYMCFSTVRRIDPWKTVRGHVVKLPAYLRYPDGENAARRSHEQDSSPQDSPPQDSVAIPSPSSSRRLRRHVPRTYFDPYTRDEAVTQTGPLVITAEQKWSSADDIVPPTEGWKHSRPSLFRADRWFYRFNPPRLNPQPIDVTLSPNTISLGSNGPMASMDYVRRPKRTADASMASDEASAESDVLRPSPPTIPQRQLGGTRPELVTSFTPINRKFSTLVTDSEAVLVRNEKQRLLAQQQQQHISTIVPQWRRPPLPALVTSKKAPPSRESGGVPEPTPEYILEANHSPLTLDRPRRILLVLDLNGTLILRLQRPNPTIFIKRPHLDRFLEYCLATFHVAIWSTAQMRNVNSIVTQLFTPQQCRRLVAVWGREHLGLSKMDFNSRVQGYKRLSQLWNDKRVQRSYSELHPGCWDQTNTVLIDDTAEKGRSEPYNTLVVPEFISVQEEQPGVLPQVHDYLNRLCYARNVSAYMRANPFKVDPSFTLSS